MLTWIARTIVDSVQDYNDVHTAQAEEEDELAFSDAANVALDAANAEIFAFMPNVPADAAKRASGARKKTEAQELLEKMVVLAAAYEFFSDNLVSTLSHCTSYGI